MEDMVAGNMGVVMEPIGHNNHVAENKTLAVKGRSKKKHVGNVIFPNEGVISMKGPKFVGDACCMTRSACHITQGKGKEMIFSQR
mmetsp:Transcript_12308/g.26194  ORF Transcript_12308/g.26194 Transcript_12308/m.26194 type:complete len:85 (+) Transcript_12308:696-950(+)